MPGRGGAGNWAAVQQEQQRGSADIEANQSSASSEAPIAGPSVPRQDRQYATSGRGGAGNWYSPSELHKTGTFQSTPTTGTSAPDAAAGWSAMLSGAQAKGRDVVQKTGRGGAGNFATYGVTAEEQRALERMQEEQKGEKLKAHVEASVNAMLAEPPKAKLSGPAPP
ncbi:hypothetical protein Slin15195_G020810 [Septoria linicola]|uniref:Uncharacterized protein n=1 Tax=Septoria linicola TaxID=215465 RepID=A0A9Q9AMJ3_9PEZI|nr:hypothetical protein Slin14017_G020880 [Septoria linicola]USW48762.1 hypothetical protein Slin15195_G020810 [Septoria linicola]